MYRIKSIVDLLTCNLARTHLFCFSRCCRIFCKIMLSANSDNCSSFQIWVSFSCLIALARPFSIMLNRCGRVDMCVIFLILGGKHSPFLPLSMMLSLGFYRCPLSGWGKVFIPSLPSFFHEGVFGFVTYFFFICWDGILLTLTFKPTLHLHLLLFRFFKYKAF